MKTLKQKVRSSTKKTGVKRRESVSGSTRNWGYTVQAGAGVERKEGQWTCASDSLKERGARTFFSREKEELALLDYARSGKRQQEEGVVNRETEAFGGGTITLTG